MIASPPPEDDDLLLDPEEPEEDEEVVEYDIATYPSDFTLAGITEMWRARDITIPDFQREFVWSIRQSSLLIDSFLLGLPVPPVFFYIDQENKNLVIDGQQRILSIAFYFEGFFGPETHGQREVFRLQGLDDRSPYSRKRFEDLADSDQRKLRNSVLRAINVRQLSPSNSRTSIYHIFERLNTGGTPLKPQEIRNCVYRGNVVTQLRELNKDPNWRLILGKRHIDKHQRDVELVLRIFALSHQVEKYRKPMKAFLNNSMSENRDADSPRFRSFYQRFPRAAENIISSLGEKPFHIRRGLNTAALDSVFCAILDNLDNLPTDLKSRYASLRNNQDFQAATQGGTTDDAVLRRRYELARETLIG